LTADAGVEIISQCDGQ